MNKKKIIGVCVVIFVIVFAAICIALVQFSKKDLEEAKKTYSEIGKFFSCKTFNTVRPTTPVAPTTASLYFFK